MLAQTAGPIGSEATAPPAQELFSPTVENRFVFNLFDLLLCGVILLVVLRGWRLGRSDGRADPGRDPLFLFLAFSSLGASFAVGAVTSGAVLFFQLRRPDAVFDVLSHALQAGAWLLLASGAGLRPRRPSWVPLVWPPAIAGGRAGGPAWIPPAAATALDVMNLALLAFLLDLFRRRPLGGRNIATGALLVLLAASSLHLAGARVLEARSSVILWNLEQFALLLSLFVFALAVGEASQDLFDRVFVRLQITFILLASVMTLTIIQLEKTDYLTSVRGRSDQLANFMRAHVEYFRARHEPLPAAVDREEFLERVAVGFGSLPELKLVRVGVEGQVATFEIAENGRIHRVLEARPEGGAWLPLDAEQYFLMHALPLAGSARDRVELYGIRTFLNRHVRARIVLIFSLFTGMVAVSTLMIGLVVRGAGATIRRQAREIEESERRLMQASKLAAIGGLAGGVAHEINNPATTILSRASFLLSQEDDTSPDAREDLQAIVTQAQRIAHITRGLLMFSRPHAHDIRAAPIAGIVDAALHSVQGRLAAHHITVIRNVRSDLPRVLADKDSLARAIENLVRNAIDAMPGGGVLQIGADRAAAAEARLRLEICDTGVGIAAAHLPRIFDPFFTTKEVGKGTGLGLAIVQGIVAEHHGTISAESKPGVGSRFIIVLPAES